MSESKPVKGDQGRKAKMTLSQLRSQQIGGASKTIESALDASASLAAQGDSKRRLQRERRLRLEEQSERIAGMKSAMRKANEIITDEEMLKIEEKLRIDMEQDIERLEREALEREESALRQEMGLRLEREEERIHEQLDLERERRVEGSKQQIRERLQGDLDTEFNRRQAFLEERLKIEADQAFQTQVRDIEKDLRTEMERHLEEEEVAQTERVESSLTERLSERELQIRAALRKRLETQLRQRLKDRETRLRAEYERRAIRLEEEIAEEIQDDLESRLGEETNRLEERMQEDLELAVARKREDLRTSVLKALEAEYSDRLAERKERLRDRYDIAFQQSVDDIETGLEHQIEIDLDDRIRKEYDIYRGRREAEISSSLASFRHEREIELRTEIEAEYMHRRDEWIEQLEIEYRSREEATERQIMSEIDARIRNERISQETSLDLIRQESSLDLEVEMETRLVEFRAAKEREVVEQLDRQIAKREEIMKNKALIEVRRREAEIRAEIEASLAAKRQEIRERLATLEARAEEFREVAEEKLHASLEQDLISDSDLEEETRLHKMEEQVQLEEADAKLQKREAWMGALQTAKGTLPAGAAARPALGGAGLGLPKQVLGHGGTPGTAQSMAAGMQPPKIGQGLGAAAAPPEATQATPEPLGALSGLQPIQRPVTALGQAAQQADGGSYPSPLGTGGISLGSTAQPLGTPAQLTPSRSPIGLKPAVEPSQTLPLPSPIAGGGPIAGGTPVPSTASLVPKPFALPVSKIGEDTGIPVATTAAVGERDRPSLGITPISAQKPFGPTRTQTEDDSEDDFDGPPRPARDSRSPPGVDRTIRKLDPDGTVRPVATPTEEVVEEETKPTIQVPTFGLPISSDSPAAETVVKGPPGGGKMVRDSGPAVSGPPSAGTVIKGPPGGGKMVRDAGPDVGGPPSSRPSVKGPPGGGKMVRESGPNVGGPPSAGPPSRGPPVRGPPTRSIAEDDGEVGQSARDSVLDEALTISRPSTIRPVTGGRRLLTPITSMEDDDGEEPGEVAILKPRMTLSPATEDDFDSVDSPAGDGDEEIQITAALKRVNVLRPTISPAQKSYTEEE